MAIRRQAFEWRNVCPIGQKYTIGHPVLNPVPSSTANNYWLPSSNIIKTRSTGVVNAYSQIVSPAIDGGRPIPIFTGQHGNNIKTSAHVLAIQMVIIDSLACWPPEANVNVFVNDTYFFEAPDYSAINGLSGFTVPFPEPNYPQYFTVESFKDGIDPPIYILPGDTWGVYVTFPEKTFAGSQVFGTGTSQPDGTSNTGSFPTSGPQYSYQPSWATGGPPNYDNQANRPEADYELARVFVKYLLIDGADFLIAQKMLEIGLPVNADSIVKYRQDLIRWQLTSDVVEGTLDEELIRETGMTTRRSQLP
jgi:hypothetical protein